MSSTAYRHVCLTDPRLIVALPDAVFRRLVLAVQAFPRFYTRRIKHRACNREGLLGSGRDESTVLWTRSRVHTVDSEMCSILIRLNPEGGQFLKSPTETPGKSLIKQPSSGTLSLFLM